MKVLLTMFNTVETHHSDRFVKVRLQRSSLMVNFVCLGPERAKPYRPSLGAWVCSS
jgi:hypothetical protein